MKIPSVYGILKEHVDDCDICYVQPLSYIKNLTTEIKGYPSPDGKILLLCKKDNSCSPQPLSLTPLRSLSREVNSNRRNSDLIGSPLRDACEIDVIEESFEFIGKPKNYWTTEEESYKSIPFVDAQNILMKVDKINARPENCCPVWIICGPNEENTLLSYIDVMRSDWFMRGFVKFNGLLPYNEIKLAALQQNHFSKMKMTEKKIKVNIDSFFNIQDTNLVLQISRSTEGVMAESFLNNNLRYDAMMLRQTIQVGDNESVAEEFWRQLTILDMIKEDVITYKESEDSNDLVYNVAAASDIKLASIQEQIYRAITDTISGSRFNYEEEQQDNDIDSVVLRAKQRELLELTDQLWGILKWCSSYSDLLQAFDYIFTCAAKYNVVNLPTNKNRVAVLIREIFQKRLAVPTLKGTEPLELLIEMGLEKVNRDFEYIFTESRLCSISELHTVADDNEDNTNPDMPQMKVRKSSFGGVVEGEPSRKTTQRKTLMHSKSDDPFPKEPIGIQNSIFSIGDVDGKLARLSHFYLVLEHVLNINANLNVNNLHREFIKDLRKSSMNFKLLKTQKTHAVEIEIRNEKLLEKIDGENPHQQRIVMFSENKFKKVKSTFYFSLAPIFPPNVFPCMDVEDATVGNKPLYYSHHLMEIATNTK